MLITKENNSRLFVSTRCMFLLVFFSSIGPIYWCLCHAPPPPPPPPFWFLLLVQPYISNTDCQRQMTQAWCGVWMRVHVPGVGRSGSTLVLLIPPNEHNLEGRLSSYICWLHDWGEEWRVRERGGKSSAVVAGLNGLSLPSCSASPPLSLSAAGLNGGNWKLNRC